MAKHKTGSGTTLESEAIGPDVELPKGTPVSPEPKKMGTVMIDAPSAASERKAPPPLPTKRKAAEAWAEISAQEAKEAAEHEANLAHVRAGWELPSRTALSERETVKPSGWQRVKNFFRRDKTPSVETTKIGVFSPDIPSPTAPPGTGGAASVNGHGSSPYAGTARGAAQATGEVEAELVKKPNFLRRGINAITSRRGGKLALWIAGGAAAAVAVYAAGSAYFGARSGRRMTRERVQADQERAMQQEMAAQQAAMEEGAMAQQAAAQQPTLMGQPLVTDGPHGNRVLAGRGQAPAAAQATEAAVNPPVETAGISAIDNKPVEQLNSPLRQ